MTRIIELQEQPQPDAGNHDQSMWARYSPWRRWLEAPIYKQTDLKIRRAEARIARRRKIRRRAAAVFAAVGIASLIYELGQYEPNEAVFAAGFLITVGAMFMAYAS